MTNSSLVALYDIRPGNRVGQFLQPRSPHGAHNYTVNNINYITEQQNDQS